MITGNRGLQRRASDNTSCRDYIISLHSMSSHDGDNDTTRGESPIGHSALAVKRTGTSARRSVSSLHTIDWLPNSSYSTTLVGSHLNSANHSPDKMPSRSNDALEHDNVTADSSSDIAKKRFSDLSAMPHPLNISPKSCSHVAASRHPPPISSSSLLSHPINRGKSHAGRRIRESRISMSNVRDQAVRASVRLKNVTVTPPDIVFVPDFFQNGGDRRSDPSRILGTSKPLPRAPDFDLEARSDVDVFNPPDGGTRAWAHAFAGFIVCFNTWGLNIAFGVFQPYYSQVMFTDHSISDVSWIGSVQLFFMFFLGSLVGLAMDRGYFRLCFNLGSLLLVLGIFLTSIGKTYLQIFLAQAVLTGIGMGMVFVSGVIVIMTYFSTNIGLAMASSASGSSAGAVVFSLLFQRTTSDGLSFAWAVRIIGFISFITLAGVNTYVKPHPGRKIPERKITWNAFKDKPYFVACAGLFLCFWGLYFGYYYIVEYGYLFLSMSPNEAVNLLIAMACTNLAGRFVFALLSDSFTGPVTMLSIASVLSSMVTFLWIGTSSKQSIYVVACFYGFSSAGIQALYAPVLYSFSQNDPSTMGQKSGLAMTIISLACLSGPPISGRLLADANGQYLHGQLFAGFSLLAGCFLLLLCRWLKVGWRRDRA